MKKKEAKLRARKLLRRLGGKWKAMVWKSPKYGWRFRAELRGFCVFPSKPGWIAMVLPGLWHSVGSTPSKAIENLSIQLAYIAAENTQKSVECQTL